MTPSTVLATKKRLDAHVDNTRVRARGIVGVQRTEDRMTGQRSLNRILGRFRIANFTPRTISGS